VAAFVELVVVDEVGVRLLHPTLRRLVELVRKRARRNRDLDALRREEAELSLPVETGRGNPVFVSQNSVMLSSTSSRVSPSATPLKLRAMSSRLRAS
jgi:hypothetical protein